MSFPGLESGSDVDASSSSAAAAAAAGRPSNASEDSFCTAGRESMGSVESVESFKSAAEFLVGSGDGGGGGATSNTNDRSSDGGAATLLPAPPPSPSDRLRTTTRSADSKFRPDDDKENNHLNNTVNEFYRHYNDTTTTTNSKGLLSSKCAASSDPKKHQRRPSGTCSNTDPTTPSGNAPHHKKPRPSSIKNNHTKNKTGRNGTTAVPTKPERNPWRGNTYIRPAVLQPHGPGDFSPPPAGKKGIEKRKWEGFVSAILEDNPNSNTTPPPSVADPSELLTEQHAPEARLRQGIEKRKREDSASCQTKKKQKTTISSSVADPSELLTEHKGGSKLSDVHKIVIAGQHPQEQHAPEAQLRQSRSATLPSAHASSDNIPSCVSKDSSTSPIDKAASTTDPYGAPSPSDTRRSIPNKPGNITTAGKQLPRNDSRMSSNSLNSNKDAALAVTAPKRVGDTTTKPTTNTTIITNAHNNTHSSASKHSSAGRNEQEQNNGKFLISSLLLLNH